MHPINKFKISSCLTAVLITLATCLYAQSSDQNYIRVRTTKEPLNSEAALAAASTDVAKVQTEIRYVDGLGRPLQVVQVKGSPSLYDIVQPFAYDQVGREDKKFLSYAATSSDGSYKANALTPGAGVYGFYDPTGFGASGSQQSNSVVVNPAPFAKTVFEPSPLNRVLEQGAPGNAWQPATSRTTTGRTIVSVYKTNNNVDWTSNNVECRKVLKYSTSVNPDFSQNLAHSGFYGDNELTVLVTEDENWTSAMGRAGTTEEYKDKEGRIVLKRSYIIVNGWELARLSTYYVYDDIGNLAFVLTPKADPDAGLTTALNQATLDDLCYQYRYDFRNRMIGKHIPGKVNWEESIYNMLDQVVFTQDSRQAAPSNPSDRKRTFFKYDAFGRLIMKGEEVNHSGDRSMIQAIVNSLSVFYETRSTASGTWNGYTNNAPPGNTNNMKLLSINYYDSYIGVSFPGIYSAVTSAISNPIGMPVASRTAVVNDVNTAYGPLLWTVSYYDDRGRNVGVYTQHFQAGTQHNNKYDVVKTTYKNKIASEVTKITRMHYTQSGSKVLKANIELSYDYDHMGRKIRNLARMSATSTLPTTTTILSQLEYNDIGQLKKKRLHSTNGTAFQQDINYLYNERGWLSQINDPAAAYSASNMFSLKLNYDVPQYGAPPQYNGNIAEQEYNSQYSLHQNIKYYYDEIHRLRYGVSSSGFSENDIKYDAMGNITDLQRVELGVNQQYYFTYSGNQLSTVTKNGSPIRSYGYDANGNATSDGQGNTITYNYLNLPAAIASKAMVYTYDAAGNKLRKVSNGVVTEYINGIQYNGANVAFIQTEEGRAIRSGSNFVYEYTLTDHLRNNRVTFDQTNGKVGENEYYPFGLNAPRQVNAQNSQLYNSKELQDELRQYDYGARFYDPVIARWTTVDPLAEIYKGWSPYNYGADNPLRYYDKDGRFLGTIIGAAVGGLIGGINAAIHHENILKGAGKGALAGAVAGAVVDLTVATAGTGTVALVAAGGLSGAAGSAVGQYLDHGKVSFKQTAIGGGAGLIGGYVGAKFLGPWVGRMFSNSGVTGTVTVVESEVTYETIVENAAEAGNNTVYLSVENDIVQYAGITNNFARRAAEHLSKKGINIDVLMDGLTRSDARAVEQALIEIHGLGKNGGTLLNQINSIAESNPAYASQLKRGFELLQSIGYKIVP